MAYRTSSLAVLTAFLVLAAAPAAAQQHQSGAADGPIVIVPASELAWGPIQPPGFDAGMEISVIRGDPSVAGQPYVIRLRFRDGYRFPPHFHPVTENLTVLEGTFLLAMGEKADESRLQTYSPGDFIFVEGEHPHFGGAIGRTTIQLHGMGPFDIIVVGSEQDRR